MSDLPSVTQVLQRVGLAPDFAFVPTGTLDHARDRGKALHLAIQYDVEGTLDESTLHEEVEPGIRAYRAFVKATEHEPMASEIELVHPQWRYRGHPDRIGLCGGLRAVCDWKFTRTFDKDYVRLQLAGYRMLWDANNPAQRIERCLGVHLKQDGTFAIHDLTDCNAEQVFLAALVVYRALQERKAL